MRGHPVFVAQHATATCCRSCLWEWHGIKKQQELNKCHIKYIVQVIEFWLRLKGGSEGNANYRSETKRKSDECVDGRVQAKREVGLNVKAKGFSQNCEATLFDNLLQ